MRHVWHTLQRYLAVAAAGLALAGLPTQARAQEDGAEIPESRRQTLQKRPPVNMDVRVGVSNRVNSTRVVPVRVMLQDNDEPISGRLVFRQQNGNTTELPVELPRKGRKQYTLYTQTANPMSDTYSWSGYHHEHGEITLHAGRRVLARQKLEPIIDGRDLLVLSVAADGASLQFLQDHELLNRDDSLIRVATLPPSELPQHWAGYEFCDLAVLNGRTWLQLDAEQKRAFRMWVEQGGSAILCGDNAQEWKDPDGAALLGVRNPRVVQHRELRAVAPWAGSTYRAQAGSLLALTGTVTGADEVLFAEQGQPLIVQAPRLRGTVMWIGFDPLREAFRSTGLAEQFWTRALHAAATRHERNSANLELPWADTARNAVNTLPKLNTPPRAAFITFGVLYALIFGPLNIWVLRRMRRTVRAWLFMPALALGMTGVVLAVGQAWGEDRNVLNGLSFLHTSAGSRTAVLQTRVGLFSPTNRSFDFTLPDPAATLQDTDPLGTGGSSLLPHVQRDEGAFWNRVAFQLFAVRTLDYQYPYDLQGTVSVFTRPDRTGAVRNEANLSLQRAFVYDADRRLYHWVGDLAAGASVALKASSWRKALPEPEPAGPGGAETQPFRSQIDALHREIGNVARQTPGGRRALWLVAECPDFEPRLRVSDLPYTNHATILMVHAPTAAVSRR